MDDPAGDVDVPIAGVLVAESAMVSARYRYQLDVVECAWADSVLSDLGCAVPWRTFRWYRGQRHYSGAYWSATVRDHVIYESRLELGRVLVADFDPAVNGIIAQPFLLSVLVGGKRRRHVPDFLLLTDSGPVLVDVKPARRLADPVVAFTFAWTRLLAEARGWRYEVWSEPPSARLENIRFLAGYRRDWLFRAELLEAIRGCGLEGSTIGQAVGRVEGFAVAVARAGVLHLLWSGFFAVPLDEPLRSSQVLGPGARR